MTTILLLTLCFLLMDSLYIYSYYYYNLSTISLKLIFCSKAIEISSLSHNTILCYNYLLFLAWESPRISTTQNSMRFTANLCYFFYLPYCYRTCITTLSMHGKKISNAHIESSWTLLMTEKKFDTSFNYTLLPFITDRLWLESQIKYI